MEENEPIGSSNRSTRTFNTYAEADSRIKSFEMETTSTFRIYKKDKSMSGVVDFTELSKHRILWSLPSISYNGIPFMIIGDEVRECHHGPDRRKKQKDQLKEQKKKDHEYNKGKKLLQNTKKQGCTATIHIRKIAKFPDFQMDGVNTTWKRKNVSRKLRQQIARKEANFEVEIWTTYPSPADHTNHLLGELAGFAQPNDERIVSKIHEYVGEGVIRVEDMKRHVQTYVKKELLVGQQVSKNNRRFYPTNKDVYNHMYRAMVNCRFSNDDQENLRAFIERYKADSPGDKFFYRSCDEASSAVIDGIENSKGFLFIHQTEWQRKMLIRYGQELCMMDATYKTSRYDLPLFFICVNTNVGNTIVASFIVANENGHNIQEALGKISEWNPDWRPQFFMTDFDEREINAVETTFTECSVYLCNFHREQAWDRWLNDHKNGLNEYKDDILENLRKIARATTDTAYSEATAELKSSFHWTSSYKLRNWLERKWFPHYKRWVQAYRQSLFNIRITTTNGLERQHHHLKRNFLQYYTECTLTSMVKTLLEKFEPESKQRYIQYNVQSLDAYRKYDEGVPEFLKDRPKFFIEHCIERIPPKATILPASITCMPSNKTYCVASEAKEIVYEVCIGDTMPSCQCQDWAKSHMPCKHLLAVLQHVEGLSWESLPKPYRDCPHFLLDPDILAEAGLRTTFPSEKTETKNSEKSFNTSEASLISAQSSQCTDSLVMRDCLHLIKNINSNLFNVPHGSQLGDILSKLSKLDSEVASLVPYEQGLPIRGQGVYATKRVSANGLKKRKRRKAIRRKVISNVEQSNIVNVFTDGYKNDLPEQNTHIQREEQTKDFPYPITLVFNDNEMEMSDLPDPATGTNDYKMQSTKFLPRWTSTPKTNGSTDIEEEKSEKRSKIKLKIPKRKLVESGEDMPTLEKSRREEKVTSESYINLTDDDNESDEKVPSESYINLTDDDNESDESEKDMPTLKKSRQEEKVPSESYINLTDDDNESDESEKDMPTLEKSRREEKVPSESYINLTDDDNESDESEKDMPTLEKSRREEKVPSESYINLTDDDNESDESEKDMPTLEKSRREEKVPSESYINLTDDDNESDKFENPSSSGDRKKLKRVSTSEDDLPLLSASVSKRTSFKKIHVSQDNVPKSSRRDLAQYNVSDVAVLPTIPDLEDVWRYHSTSSTMMAVIGPYKLRGSSFGFMKPGKEISDEVINAYMRVLTQNNSSRGVMAIDCLVWGAVMSKNSTEKLPKVDLTSHQIVLCPFNSGGHWELMAVYPTKRLVIYLNSLGETVEDILHYRRYWRALINRRLNEGLESMGPKAWSFETISHTKQLDSVNCGVFVMKFAQMLIEKENPRSTITFNQRRCDQERENIASILLAESGDVRNICRECSLSYHPTDNWVQCNSCRWWLHHHCSPVASKSITSVNRNSITVLCRFCEGTDCDHQGGVVSQAKTNIVLQAKTDIVSQAKTNIVFQAKTDHQQQPFVFHKRTRQIKICRGCNLQFSKDIAHPNDFVLQRKESYDFFDKKNKEMKSVNGNRYYHVSANCVRAKCVNVKLHPDLFCIPFGTHFTSANRKLFKANGVDVDGIENKSLF